jgi:hypothetical protein
MQHMYDTPLKQTSGVLRPRAQHPRPTLQHSLLSSFVIIPTPRESSPTNGKATFFNTAKAITLTCNSELAVAAVTSSPAANVGVRYTGIRHFDCLVSEFVDIKI